MKSILLKLVISLVLPLTIFLGVYFDVFYLFLEIFVLIASAGLGVYYLFFHDSDNKKQ